MVLGYLNKNLIKTAKDWLELPDDRKKRIEDAGLPYAVINSLNDAVRQGLLLPAFKYRQQVSFLADEVKYSTIGEASSVVQCAEIVDDAWNLARKNCDLLCHIYEQLCEWSIKQK